MKCEIKCEKEDILDWKEVNICTKRSHWSEDSIVGYSAAIGMPIYDDKNCYIGMLGFTTNMNNIIFKNLNDKEELIKEWNIRSIIE